MTRVELRQAADRLEYLAASLRRREHDFNIDEPRALANRMDKLAKEMREVADERQ